MIYMVAADVLRALGWEVVINEEENYWNLVLTNTSSSEDMPESHKSCLRGLLRGWLMEFNYEGGRQQVNIYKELHGLDPEDDRYSCLDTCANRTDDNTPQYELNDKEIFVRRKDRFARYVLAVPMSETKQESKGERIRKVIYGWIYTQPSQFFDGGFSKEEMLAWLEQGEVFDKIVERARTEKQRVLVTESDGVANIDWDTRSLQDAKLLMEYGLNYIKKKLSKQDKNKLLPKFSVGQRIRNRRGEMHAFVIDRIEDDSYKGKNGESISVVFQDDWELVEQQPAGWSKEDEGMLNQVIEDIVKLAGPYVCYHKDVDWLKSLKDRMTWKPSEEQMERRKEACDEH